MSAHTVAIDIDVLRRISNLMEDAQGLVAFTQAVCRTALKQDLLTAQVLPTSSTEVLAETLEHLTTSFNSLQQSALCSNAESEVLKVLIECFNDATEVLLVRLEDLYRLHYDDCFINLPFVPTRKSCDQFISDARDSFKWLLRLKLPWAHREQLFSRLRTFVEKLANHVENLSSEAERCDERDERKRVNKETLKFLFWGVLVLAAMSFVLRFCGSG